MSGHFIAYCKSPVNQKWYLYNDSIVKESNNDFDNLNDNKLNSIPYVLFYQTKESNKQLDVIQNPNKISVNMENETNNEITLYFNFPNGKELYLDIKENEKFNDVIMYLIQKYNISSTNYKFYKGNHEEINGTKTSKELNLKNEEHIKVE